MLYELRGKKLDHPIINKISQSSRTQEAPAAHDSGDEIKTTLEFSSADSLESHMSLVSGGVSQVSQVSQSSSEVTEVIVNAERGTREKRYKDGRVEICYSNGNRKEISSGLITVYYYNGDMKETHKNGLVKYLYNDTSTWHTKYPDGRELTQFSNGQTEVSCTQQSSDVKHYFL